MAEAPEKPDSLPAKPDSEEPEATSDEKGEGQPQPTTAIPPDMQELVAKLPAKTRETFLGMMTMGFQGPMSNPLLAKIDGEHVHKVLDMMRDEGKRESESERSARRYGAFYFLAGSAILAGFVVFMIVYLSSTDPTLLKSMLVGFAVLSGGLGGGYGIKTHLESKKRD